MMAGKGLYADDAATVIIIRKDVQSYLRRQSGTLVHPAGRWRVAG